MKSGTCNNLAIFSPDSTPYGISYAQWTARWWQWLYSLPLDCNPLKDNIGNNCAINQSGPVWFLAGSKGEAAKRNCTISADKALLIPILNYGATLADEPDIKSEHQLQLLAKREMDKVLHLRVTFNGVQVNELKKNRIQSPIFDVVLPKNSIFGGDAGPTRGISDGYWLFLKPLPRGQYTISNFGSCEAGRIKIGTNYDITIT
jgi:hypothetical protein